MKKYTPALLSALSISALLMFSPLIQADEKQKLSLREQELNQREQELNQREQHLNVKQSYGEKVAEKAWSGFTNINTGILEIPKNIINTTNNSEYFILGFAGGMAKGFLHAIGRMATGLADVVTAPLITQPIVQPDPIWHDFDAETTYGPVFRLDNESEQYDPSIK